jgi:hypothetical protein
VSTTTKDTFENVTESVMERDTMIVTDASSSEVNTLLKDLLDGQERISSNGNSTTTLKYNTVTKEVEADCECGEMDLMIKLFDKLIEKETTTTTTTETNKTKSSFWDQIKMLLIGAALMFGGLLIAKVLK